MQNLTWYQTRTIRRNRNSNKIVLSGSRVFRAIAPSKGAVLDQSLFLSFNSELGFSLDQFSKKLLCKMMKERAILIESCVDDQELA